MKNNKPKKNKKQPDNPINELANDILTDIEQEIVEHVEDDIFHPEDMLPPEEEEVISKKSKGKIPQKQEEVSDKIEKKIITIGHSPNDPIVIFKNNREIEQIFFKLFGNKNGDFFILNESMQNSFKNGVKRKLKFIIIEDKHHFRYSFWFDISKLSYSY